MSGAAITICPQQLKGLFGLAYFTIETDMISVVHAVLKNPDEVSGVMSFEIVGGWEMSEGNMQAQSSPWQHHFTMNVNVSN